MDATKDAGTDVDRTDDEIATGTAGPAAETPVPISAPLPDQRVDVRRRVMALRRW